MMHYGDLVINYEGGEGSQDNGQDWRQNRKSRTEMKAIDHCILLNMYRRIVFQGPVNRKILISIIIILQ